MMKVARPVVVAGMLAYAVSFLLVTASDDGGSLRGFECAYATLLIPFQDGSLQHGGLFENRVMEYIALLFSGWINIAFLAATTIRARSQRVFGILRAVTLLLIPFCWIAFYYQGLYPREGHFVWIVGMLLVLFRKSAGQPVRPERRALINAISSGSQLGRPTKHENGRP